MFMAVHRLRWFLRTSNTCLRRRAQVATMTSSAQKETKRRPTEREAESGTTKGNTMEMLKVSQIIITLSFLSDCKIILL